MMVLALSHLGWQDTDSRPYECRESLAVGPPTGLWPETAFAETIVRCHLVVESASRRCVLSGLLPDHEQPGSWLSADSWRKQDLSKLNP